ncbi:MAG: hypothetical protein E5V75_19905 [Mesorhizobium sp.]|nr:hypothetical protein EOA29_21465 [Mesorhizobium sp. M1E.F.Ca.ET.063.01.1.1]TKB14071.1 MAG: hypothetical protein E5V75_19905 [Mesorhizobium sp.]
MNTVVEAEHRVSPEEKPMPSIECRRCHGARKVFVCERWVSSNGHCCPEGTHRLNCPGQSMACLECGGHEGKND